MRGIRKLFGATALVVVGFLGCAHDKQFKPPKPDPEMILPPQDDPRFSTYPKYPDKTLNEFPKKKALADEFGGPSGGAGPNGGFGGTPGRPGRPGVGMGGGGGGY